MDTGALRALRSARRFGRLNVLAAERPRRAPNCSVERSARIGAGSRLGAGCRIGRLVDIGRGCAIGADSVLMQGVVVGDHTLLGAGVVAYPGAALGLAPQDRKYRGGATRLVVGDGCVVRDGARLERGTEAGGGETRVGPGCLIMSGAYVGHDARLGAGAVVANSASIGGHAQLQRGCVVGGHAAVHQRVRVGAHAMVAGMVALRRDVLPWCVVCAGGALRGLNARQLFPRLGFRGRRAAVALYHVLFPSGAAEARARALGLPCVRGRALSERVDALDAVDVAALLERWRAPEGAVGGGEDEVALLRTVVGDVVQFAREAEATRGLCLPAARD